MTSCGHCNSIKGDRLFGSIEECKVYILKRRAELQITFEAVKQAVRGVIRHFPASRVLLEPLG